MEINSIKKQRIISFPFHASVLAETTDKHQDKSWVNSTWCGSYGIQHSAEMHVHC